MTRRGTGTYTEDWPAIARRVKDAAGWCCVRCHAPHQTGRILTIHHADMNKANNRWFNLLPLCQQCHLRIQGRVFLDRPWIWEHTDWFKPYVAGFYAFTYLGLDLTRAEVEARMEELLALEAQAIVGSPPVPLVVTS